MYAEALLRCADVYDHSLLMPSAVLLGTQFVQCHLHTVLFASVSCRYTTASLPRVLRTAASYAVLYITVGLLVL